MLSASEAKVKTQNVRDNYEKDLKRIEDQINAAICQGQFDVSSTGYLSHLVIEQLSRLGYEIEVNRENVMAYDPTNRVPIASFTNNPYYIIRWS